MTDMAEVHESIEVSAPVRQVYTAWTNFTQFPRFMENVVEVRETGEGRYHWKARGPRGRVGRAGGREHPRRTDRLAQRRT